MADKFDNIAPVHSSCAEERLRIFQYFFKGNEKILDTVDYVKTTVKTTHQGDVEHMWVKIDSIDYENQVVKGRLWNKPILSNEIIDLESPIEVPFNQVSQIM